MTQLTDQGADLRDAIIGVLADATEPMYVADIASTQALSRFGLSDIDKKVYAHLNGMRKQPEFYPWLRRSYTPRQGSRATWTFFDVRNPNLAHAVVTPPPRVDPPAPPATGVERASAEFATAGELFDEILGTPLAEGVISDAHMAPAPPAKRVVIEVLGVTITIEVKQ